MKKPSLEEVKEYFKNAKKILSVKLTEFKNKESYWDDIECDRFNGIESIYIKNGKFEVWNSNKGYAKIITYKEPKEKTFVITKEQIHEFHEFVLMYDKESADKVKEWFPKAFEHEKKELVVGKWYKAQSSLFCYQENDNSYGFTDSIWSYCKWVVDIDRVKDNKWNPIEATPEEVKEALTKEAVKRYKVGDYCKSASDPEIFNFTYNGNLEIESNLQRMNSNGWAVFYKGKWAEIIPTITKAEAEQKLNCKII